MSTDQQLQRQIHTQRDSETHWLQQMLFAFGKAQETRMKLAETTGEDLNPLIILEDGTQVPLDTLREIIQKRVDFLMQALGRRIHSRPR